MAENFHTELLCADETTACFDDDEAINGIGIPLSWHNQKDYTLRKNPIFKENRSNFLMAFQSQSQEIIREMIEREREHLPRDDYLKRLRTGDLDWSVRREAINWILKACDHYKFGPLCICLSINYLDRFLSVRELPRSAAWTVQLLAVACLSLASKLEETQVPQSVELQVGEPKFIFEAKTIQRMELFVLTNLKWRLKVLTPCMFIDYFLTQISGDQEPSSIMILRSVQLILSITKGIDFLEFRPSEVAAAVAISVSEEWQAVHIDKATSSLTLVKKERVMKCVKMMKDLSLIGGSASACSASLPYSPIGVLDAANFSRFKSADLTTLGSSANSSHIWSTESSERRK